MIRFSPLTKGMMVLSLALVMAGTAQSESTSCPKFRKCGGCDISILRSVLSDDSAEISLTSLYLGRLLNSGYIEPRIWQEWGYFTPVPIVLEVVKDHEGVSEQVFSSKIRDITFDRGLGGHSQKITGLDPDTSYMAVAYTGVGGKGSSDPFARICFRTNPDKECPELTGRRHQVISSDGSSYFIVGGQKEREDCPGTGLSGFFVDN